MLFIIFVKKNIQNCFIFILSRTYLFIILEIFFWPFFRKYDHFRFNPFKFSSSVHVIFFSFWFFFSWLILAVGVKWVKITILQIDYSNKKQNNRSISTKITKTHNSIKNFRNVNFKVGFQYSMSVLFPTFEKPKSFD